VTAAGRTPAPPLPVEKTDLISNEWVRWGLLAGLGAAASYLSVNIPYTEVFIEGRWIFGFIGIALLRQWWTALLLVCILCLTGFHKLPLGTVFIGNMLYALPTFVVIRTLHRRVLNRIRRSAAYGAAWFAMIMICYQLLATPIIWGFLAFLEGAPIWAGMVEGWRTQPYLVESLLVAVVSASLMMIVRSHRALRDSRQELATTLYSIGDGVITTDTQGRIRRMNPTAEALTGWRESEAVGQPLEAVFRIVDEETHTAVENPVRRAMREGTVVGLSNHTLLITRDGVERPIMDSAAPIRDAEGHVSGVILVFQDQTEERAAQQALEASRARLLLALRRARMGIWDWDVTTDGVAWHGEYASIFGTPLAEFGGTLDDVRARVHPDDWAEGFALLRRAVETGEAFTNTYRTVWPDGSIHWAQSYGAPITDELGRTQRVIGTIQDVTERRMIEQQLHRQERLAAVGQLAAGIAHDFRNLLSTIILYAQMPMMDEELPPQLHRHLRTIVDESYKASDLVQQLLDFASQAIIERHPLDLVTLVEDVLGVLKRTIPEHIHFIVEIEDARPGTYTVAVDPGRIQQALTNLTLNARDAMPEGGDLRVTIARLHVSEGSTPPVAEMAPGDWVRLTMSDTGVGMTEEVQAHLFEPFFTTKEVGEGTGLGLAQVFGIVRQHEGHIDVATAPGDGTTFLLYLPAHTGEAKEAAAP
jgi:PAS domain S-box-containing protein